LELKQEMKKISRTGEFTAANHDFLIEQKMTIQLVFHEHVKHDK